ncbi:hypothetical protein AGMMS50289_23430 [Betaproteobacteria bacterium]|nr:hypothetical protein AGMMS50289_23430 [Betaproteobacteria bacterium]
MAGVKRFDAMTPDTFAVLFARTGRHERNQEDMMKVVRATIQRAEGVGNQILLRWGFLMI